ncbi:MAG: fumarylacetoacetate hydrolase family protein [Hyphomicrobiales bacterium]|nr:fumarylacetoacetate hydrolase family protein [Hyphomicrobiales bacterium]
MNYLFPPPSVPTLPVKGTDMLYPVHRIYCVGRNYAAHAREMGHDPDREPPFFFQKNPDTIVLSGGTFPYPDKSENVHYEMELVVALGKGGKDISVVSALEHVFGYAAGLDMTRRDLQGAAKKMGRPWEVGKAFEYSAPCGEITPASNSGHPSSGRLWIEVNGEVRQDSNIDQMIWNVPETISYLSGVFTLREGDLIYTGTPAGVGAINRGDQMNGYVEGIGEISISVV